MLNTKTIKWFLILAILAVVLFFLRGTPKSEIPIPQFEKIEQPTSIGDGRPIPYHEVLVGYRNWFNLYLLVYNDLNDVLPDEEFHALEESKIKEETKANMVIKNGPRFWVLDKITGNQKSPIWSLQGHDFLVPAFLEINFFEIANRKPYHPMEVIRDTKYTYYKNTLIYKLISPIGEEYIMQAASKEIKSNLELKDLEFLKDKLNLKEGWKYEVEKITTELILESNGKTQIVQDDLRNTYQLLKQS